MILFYLNFSVHLPNMFLASQTQEGWSCLRWTKSPPRLFNPITVTLLVCVSEHLWCCQNKMPHSVLLRTHDVIDGCLHYSLRLKIIVKEKEYILDVVGYPIYTTPQTWKLLWTHSQHLQFTKYHVIPDHNSAEVTKFPQQC